MKHLDQCSILRAWGRHLCLPLVALAAVAALALFSHISESEAQGVPATCKSKTTSLSASNLYSGSNDPVVCDEETTILCWQYRWTIPAHSACEPEQNAILWGRCCRCVEMEQRIRWKIKGCTTVPPIECTYEVDLDVGAGNGHFYVDCSTFECPEEEGEMSEHEDCGFIPIED